MTEMAVLTTFVLVMYAACALGGWLFVLLSHNLVREPVEKGGDTIGENPKM
jgi:hypothetical protein